MEKKKSTDHVLFIFIVYPQTTDSQSLIYVQRVNDKERKKTNPKHPNRNVLKYYCNLDHFPSNILQITYAAI